MEAKEKLNKQQDNDVDVLEDVLNHVGDFGRYQKLLFLAMLPFGFFFAFIYFVQMFVTATPQRHWCKVPELAHLDMELRRNLSAPGAVDGSWDRCHTFQTNWSLVLQTLTPPDPSTPLVSCNEWEFELSDIPYATVVSERGWVCQYGDYVPTAQAMFFAGSLIGGIFFGWLADNFGRVPSLIVSNLIGCVGGIATTFTTGLWDFAFCRLVVGMAYDNAFMMMYILVLEYTGPRYRTIMANMSIAIYFGSGCLVLPWLALWIGNWKNLLWVTSLPMLCVLVAIWTVPESARWLLTRGRVNQAVDVLKKFEKVNGTKIPEDIMEDFIVSSRQTKQSNESIITLMKSPPLRTTLILMLVVYMACACIFDGLVRMSENLGLDFFVTFTLTSATEIPSVTLVAFLLDRWGRRNLTCGPLCISGVLILIATLVPKGVPQTALAIAGRFFINMSYNGVIQWATEVLPTGVRASGSSMVHMSGYVATIMSPYIVFSERLWDILPLLILGVVALVAAGLGVIIPETKGLPMPQTIADGERIIREHSLCGKPEKDDVEIPQWKTENEKALVT